MNTFKTLKNIIIMICAPVLSAALSIGGVQLNAQAQDWEEVGAGSAAGGGISNSSGDSGRPSIAFRADDTPCIAWNDDTSGNSEIYVRCWNGNAWSELGSSSATGGGVSDNDGDSAKPALAVAADGTIYLAWHDDTRGNYEIVVKQWTGNVWEDVGGNSSAGGVSNNDGDSTSPALAIGSDGMPIIVWQDDSAGNLEIYVRRWDGNIWAALGTDSAAGGGVSNTAAESSSPSLTLLDEGDAYVAWADKNDGDNEIYVRRFSMGTWVAVGDESAFGGGISDNDGVSRTPSLALDSYGAPVVAWSDDSAGTYEILAKRWDGNIWSPTGINGASNGGIDQSSGNSHAPRLAIATDGTIFVGWYHKDTADAEIFIRRLEGDQWLEVGAGSAMNGGVSNNKGASSIPDLALDSQGVPYLTWGDDSSGNYEIFVSYWTGDPAPPSPTATNTPSVTPIPTQTPTVQPTATATSLVGPTSSATVPSTATATIALTPTRSHSQVLFPLVLQGATATATPIPTSTPPPLPTATPTMTWIPTSTATQIATVTSTATVTKTPMATNTPQPTATPTRNSSACHPSYPTVCIPPPPPDLDCGDIPYRNFKVLPPDPHGFDGNKNGIGCET